MATELPHIRQMSDIGPALLMRISETVSPETVADTIKAMLTAEHETKGGDMYPDWRAREAGAKLYLSYMIGMPVQRQVTLTQTPQTDEETLARLLSSPASKRALKVALLGDD